jgi:hypothetical protein
MRHKVFGSVSDKNKKQTMSDDVEKVLITHTLHF